VDGYVQNLSWGSLADIISCAEFCCSQLRGFNSVRGQNSPFCRHRHWLGSWRNVSSSIHSDQCLQVLLLSSNCMHVEYSTCICNPFSFISVLQNRCHSVFITNTDSHDHRPQCVILGSSRDALYWKMKMKMKTWPVAVNTVCDKPQLQAEGFMNISTMQLVTVHRRLIGYHAVTAMCCMHFFWCCLL